MPEALILEFTGVSNADYESVNQQLGMAIAAVVFWRARRRKQAAPAGWMEATCPACIAVNLLTDRVSALAELTEREPEPVTQPAGPGPGNAAPGARHRAPR